MASSLTNLLCHIVFSTSGRVALVTENESRKVGGRFEWQAVYFAASVSESRVSEVLPVYRDERYFLGRRYRRNGLLPPLRGFWEVG